MDMELRERKRINKNEFLGDVEPGSVLGCRTILNQAKTQAHLILKTHHTLKFYKMSTLLPRKAHEKPHCKKRDPPQKNLEKTGAAFLRKEGRKQPT